MSNKLAHLLPAEKRSMSRSENMRRIRGKDTRPEIFVRSLLRDLGFFGYRLHRKELPGKPDIVFVGRRKAIFVHGCFWHGHDCKVGIRKPKSNQNYWIPKIERTQQRDATNFSDLRQLGWLVLTIWECELLDQQCLIDKIVRFMHQEPGRVEGSSEV